MRFSGLLLIIVVSGALSGSVPKGHLQAVPPPRTIFLTRVIRLPVKLLKGSGEFGQPGSESLAVSPGATDELPDGPSGFDILDDGRILITDPLQNRIGVFDTSGKFLEAWKTAFAADSVKVLANRAVLIRQANTGEVHVFSSEGRPRVSEGATLPLGAEARLSGGNSGTVIRPGAGTSRGELLAIQYDHPRSTLLSLEWLDTDPSGNTYVALEATTGEKEGAESVDLSKRVRKYAADGMLVAETVDVPLDYYVPPVDEFRVSNGNVYQLFTTESEVRINVWNMN